MSGCYCTRPSGSVPEWPKGGVCKTPAQATLVRIQPGPPDFIAQHFEPRPPWAGVPSSLPLLRFPDEWKDCRVSNADQIEYWNGPEGAHWVDREAQFDAMLAPFIDRILDAAQLQPTNRVLDVGCGSGATSRGVAARARLQSSVSTSRRRCCSGLGSMLSPTGSPTSVRASRRAGARISRGVRRHREPLRRDVLRRSGCGVHQFGAGARPRRPVGLCVLARPVRKRVGRGARHDLDSDCGPPPPTRRSPTRQGRSRSPTASVAPPRAPTSPSRLSGGVRAVRHARWCAYGFGSLDRPRHAVRALTASAASTRRRATCRTCAPPRARRPPRRSRSGRAEQSMLRGRPRCGP